MIVFVKIALGFSLIFGLTILNAQLSSASYYHPNKTLDSECHNNNGCSGIEVCIGGKCVAVCDILVCEMNRNEICKASNHMGLCYSRIKTRSTEQQSRTSPLQFSNSMLCLPEFGRKNQENCRNCTEDEHCGKNNICKEYQCVNDCVDLPCFKKYTCKPHEDFGNQCICLNNMHMDKYGNCRRCTNNCHCNREQKCRRNKCVNVCANLPCFEKKSCKPSRHIKRKCVCSHGLKMDLRGNCQNCTRNCHCRGQQKCKKNQCINICADQPCFRNHTCAPSPNIHKKCVCLNGRHMNEFGMCEDCTNDSHCKLEETCKGNRCQHVCENLPCFTQMIRTCEASSSVIPKTCACKPHYMGSPWDACYTGTRCKRDTDCPYNERCFPYDAVSTICIDVCKCESCRHLKCKIIAAHKAQCACDSNLRDNGTTCVTAEQLHQQIIAQMCVPLRNPHPDRPISCDNGCNATSVCCNNECLDVCKARQCPKGQQCSYVGTNGFCHCPDNHYMEDDKCIPFEKSKQCSHDMYYDEHFNKCRKKCYSDEHCYMDEICDRARHECFYLCGSPNPKETCIPMNRTIERRLIDCKSSGGTPCRCPIGMYMSEDRMICHHHCSDELPCRNNLQCNAEKICV